MSFQGNVINNSTTDDTEYFCKLILYWTINKSSVRIWDVLVFIPNCIFLIYLLIRFRQSRLKLLATSSPIFGAFYALVIADTVFSCIRCILSMLINASIPFGGHTDKLLWVIVRFFLLSTEISVVTFALGCGRLDSQHSIKHVLIVTGLISFAYTFLQGVLEVVVPDDSFHIRSKDFDLYGHGGMLFWFYSSMVFSLSYFVVFVLRWTKIRFYLLLPRKQSFYVYVFSLGTLDFVQTLGSGLLSYGYREGLCVINATSFLYFTLLTPFVYWAFLSEFFGSALLNMKYSYNQTPIGFEDNDVDVNEDGDGNGDGDGDEHNYYSQNRPTFIIEKSTGLQTIDNPLYSAVDGNDLTSSLPTVATSTSVT